MKIAVASKNAHKVKELSKMLNIKGLELVSLKDLGFQGEIEENGKTFSENALIKAREVSKKYNLPALADDSGLCVDALNGEPGIFSARYASADGQNSSDLLNTKKLLENLKGVPEEKRTARFVSAIALVLPNGEEKCVEGICEGIITEEICGQGGFGYDPVFFYPPSDKTFGELTDEEKNAVSHRAIAVEKIKKELLNI